jgi:phage gp29-like protein
VASIFGNIFTRPKLSLTVEGSDNFTARSVRSTVAAASVPAVRASVRAELPALRAQQALPAQQPPRYGDQGLRNRAVQSDPLGDWYLNLPDKVPPKQISSILRMALAGNIWQQTQLSRLMADSWPVFAKCCFELRTAISSAKYVVHPFTRKDEKPSASAEAKADLVTEALNSGFQPDRFADEDGINGMVFDLTDAIVNGVSVTELIWNEDETMVRASAWVHPRNLAFTPDGRIGVAYAAESGYMSFSNQVRHDLMDDPDKFLVAKFKSKSGSYLGAGWMRKLTAYWVMIVYGRDFYMNFAQKYGNPFFDIAYDATVTDQTEINKFEELAKMAANQGFLVHPNSTEVKIGAAHTAGADNAQLAMMRLADEQCTTLMLGQTLTSSAPVNGGTRAQGDIHADVRNERIQEHCRWIARILTEQLADSICRVNFGKSYEVNPERPTVELDTTQQLTIQEKGTILKDVSQTQIPIKAETFYKKIGEEMPQPGDLVLQGGQLVILEEPMTATEKGQKDFDTQLQQQKAVNNEFGNPDHLDEQGVQAALAAASPEDRMEFEQLVTAAERAPHANGEITLVQAKLKQLVTKSRK